MHLFFSVKNGKKYHVENMSTLQASYGYNAPGLDDLVQVLFWSSRLCGHCPTAISINLASLVNKI